MPFLSQIALHLSLSFRWFVVGFQTNLNLFASASCFVPSTNASSHPSPHSARIAFVTEKNTRSTLGRKTSSRMRWNAMCEGSAPSRMNLKRRSNLHAASSSLRVAFPRANPRRTAAKSEAWSWPGLPPQRQSP